MHDSEVRGLKVRISETGAKSYVCMYTAKSGARRLVTLGDAGILTLAQARDRARQILGDVAGGADPGGERQAARRDVTLKQFLEGEYGSWARSNLKSGESRIAFMLVSLAPLMNKRLSAITPFSVEKWRAGEKAKGRGVKKPATLNRSIAYLKAAMTKAVEWNVIPSHDLRKVKLPREDSARVRYLDGDEYQRLIDALDRREEELRTARDSHNLWLRQRRYPERPDLRALPFADRLKPMMLVSMNTGLRKGELFSLEWADIDIPRATLTVRGSNAKSGKTRHVPLNSLALDALTKWKEQQPDTDGLVFPSADGGRLDNVKKSFQCVLRDAGISGFTWHDQRHHFASMLAMSGADLNVVRELLGHADFTTTLRYAHLAPEHKARAVEAIVPRANIVPFRAAEGAE